MNNFFKFIIIGLVLIIGLSIFYIINNNNQGLDVGLTGPDEVMAGVPFDFKVEFSNQIDSVLKNVSIIVSLPEGAVFAGSGEEKLVDNKDLGDIGQGSLISESYKIIFLKGIGEKNKIKTLVSYSSGSSKYEKEEEKEINILDSGVSVEIKAPEKVFGGEEFDISVNYKNISEVDFSELELVLEYPASFTFISSDSKADSGNNIWELGDLRKGSEGSFNIKGSVAGPDNSPVVFKANLNFNLNNQKYHIDLKDIASTISPSPLSLLILLNDKGDYVTKLNDELKYNIGYINNTDVPLKEAVVRVQIKGELFDLDSLDSKAVFRKTDNTLIWNSSNTPELNYIAPRSAGFVSFIIKTKTNYPIRRLGDKDFVLSVKAEIESPTVPGFLNASRTYNVSKIETKVAGDLVLSSKAFFRDALSGILNKGTLPLKVDQPINFTIHWILKSFAADFTGIELRAPLKEGVRF
ncbi:MAG: COG1361 family protein, partial [Minisyncoccota bacterium]